MEFIVRILIFLVVILFVSVSLFVAKLVSGGGKLSRKLGIINAAGWLIILPLSSGGHPPPFLIPTLLFWLVNLVSLPAAAFALWVSYREREERIPYLAVAFSYIAMSLLVLFVVPLILMVMQATSTV